MGDGGIGILERTIKLIEKYGTGIIYKALFVIAMFFCILYNNINIGNIVEEVLVSKENKHDKAVEYRKSIASDIRIYLKDLLADSGADRAFIIEMHNGTNNINGLPFMYGEMTYEEVTPGTEHIDEDYTSINMSRFCFITYLCENYSWNGSIDSLNTIDDKMALRMKSNGVKYAFFKCMYGSNGKEIGFIGITYTKPIIMDDKKVDTIRKMVNKTSDLMVLKLDIKNII